MQYLAIDVGGTSTRAAVIEPGGTCTGYGAAGSGNPTSVGLADAASAIVVATRRALDGARAADGDVVAGTVGIAGAGGEMGVALLAELAAAGIGIPLTLEADLLAAFCAGSLATSGYAIVSGTGAAAVRIRDVRIDATCDGLGWLVGDRGSGFWIGRRAVRAVAASLDGRAPDTALVEPVLDALQVGRSDAVRLHGRPGALNGLIAVVYRLRPVELARLAPLVFDCAADGDGTALQIVDAAAAALSGTLARVLDRSTPGPLVLCGSVLARQPAVADAVTASFRAAQGASATAIPVSDGLPGAAVLALRRAGVDVDDASFRRLHDTLSARR